MDSGIRKKRSKAPLIIVAVVAVLAVITVLYFTVFSGSAVEDRKIREQLSLAERYFEEMDYEQAIAAYRAVLDIDPNHSDALHGLEDSYLAWAEEEPDDAAEIYEEALTVLRDLQSRADTETAEYLDELIARMEDEAEQLEASNTAEKENEADEEEGESAIEESKEEAVADPRNAWLDEHGIVIDRYSADEYGFFDFSFDTMLRSKETGEDLEPFTVTVTGWIEDTSTPEWYKLYKEWGIEDVAEEILGGIPDGYKQVSIQYSIDYSGVKEGTIMGWSFGAFDRYTGTELQFSNPIKIDDNNYDLGSGTIDIGGKTYDLTVSIYEIEYTDKTASGRITVECPIDYDGIVFMIGGNDHSTIEANSNLDYDANRYTIDTLPNTNSGYRYYFFTYSND